MREYRLGLYEKAMPNELSLEEKLLLAQRCGFDFVELSIDETQEKMARLDMGTEEIAALKDFMTRSGIYFETMCLSAHRKYPLGSGRPQVRERGMELLKKAVRFSRDLGIRIIQLAGYDVYYEESTPETGRLFQENLKRGVAYAAQYGVILAFETMETPFMNTVEKARRYVDAIRSPYLQVYPDIGNIRNATEDYLGDLHRGEGVIAAAHLKETAAGVFRDLEYGKGRVDFPGCLSALLQAGVKRFTCEFWYDGHTPPEEYVQRNLQYIKEFLPL